MVNSLNLFVCMYKCVYVCCYNIFTNDLTNEGNKKIYKKNTKLQAAENLILNLETPDLRLFDIKVKIYFYKKKV